VVTVASLAEFTQSLEAKVASARSSAVSALGAEPLAWLVLPPIWSEGLARAVSFPVEPGHLGSFIARCEELGWCQRRSTPTPSGPEDAAEILISLIAALRRDHPESRALQSAISAARPAIEHIPVRIVRRKLYQRLAEHASDAVAVETEPEGPAEPPRPAHEEEEDAESVFEARRLVEHGVWRDLENLIREVIRPPDLRRIVPELAATAPEWLLLIAVTRVAAECAPRDSSKMLEEVATMLPRSSVADLANRIVGRERPGRRGTESVIVNLAIAAGKAGDNETALGLCDRLADDLARAGALSELVGIAAASGSTGWVREIVSRIERVIISGDGIDLTGAASAVLRLAKAGMFAAAEPILDVVYQRMRPERLSASDIGALAQLADALRDTDRDAAQFVELAIRVAQRNPSPAVRSAGLAKILPSARGPANLDLVDAALASARQVTAAVDRARALTRLVRYLSDDQIDEVTAEVISALPTVRFGDVFWVPDGARADIFSELQRQKGLPWLRECARRIGATITEMRESALVPGTMRRWAELAATLAAGDEAGDVVGAALLDRVEPLLNASLTAEALAWIETGRRLLAVIKGTFDTSLLIASRKVELVRRTEDDRRQLQRFLRREDQIDAFRALLATDDEAAPWALHYLGPGGVGKTLTLRYIAAELAPAESFVVARVDFDHLDPDFPRRPRLLLLHILDELEVYAGEANRELYELARKILLHQPAASEHFDAVPPTFDQGVQSFCGYLETCGRPIVLMFDTCEQLAKFDSVGAVFPQLEAAFRLLERVHAEVPSVRVIFAGRRPLARKVYGDHGLDAGPAVDCLPAAKPYLLVHEVTGFTGQEAGGYLSDMEGLTLSDATVEELLRLSQTGPPEFWYSGHPDDRQIRHIPFDLAQYAAVLREDPDYLETSPRNLAYATYVADRIAGPLERDLKTMLPAVVAMRRFDRDMLIAATVPLKVASDKAWLGLSGLEWISADSDESPESIFLEVDRTMLERLEAYFSVGDQRAELEAVRQGIAQGLADLVLRRPIGRLGFDHVDAALRCLPPADAADLCDELSLRVAADGHAWMRAYVIFSRVLGPEGALADPGHAAAASAHALHTTALSQIKPAEDLSGHWSAIAKMVANATPSSVTRWIAMRGHLLGASPDVIRWSQAIELVGESRQGSDADRRRAIWLVGTVLLAATRRLLSAAAEGDRSAAAADEGALRQVARGDFGPEVTAVATALIARARLTRGDRDQAAVLLMRALIEADNFSQDLSEPEAAADGGVPYNVRDRLRLVAALTDLPEVLHSSAFANEWLPAAVDKIERDTRNDEASDPDSDRLAALLLSRRLDDGPLPPELVAQMSAIIGTRPPPPATVPLHDHLSPLRIVLSRAWLAVGDAGQARDVLGPRDITDVASDQRKLDLERIEIARRMRLVTSDAVVRVALSEEFSVSEVPRVFEAMSLLGEGPLPPPEPYRPPQHLHAWWHAEIEPLAGRTHDYLDTAFQVARQWCDDSQLALAEALRLDQVELTLLTPPHRRRRGNNISLPPELAAGPPVTADDESWRLALREAVLRGQDVRGFSSEETRPSGSVDQARFFWQRRPGTRRLAELALDEGEMLALRLPEPGGHLLAAASSWFKEAGDPVGAFIALTAERLALARSLGKSPNLQDLRADYVNVADSIGLPSWSALKDDAKYRAAVEAMDSRTLAAWEGWLLALRQLLRSASSSVPEDAAIPPELRIGRYRASEAANLITLAKRQSPEHKTSPGLEVASPAARRPTAIRITGLIIVGWRRSRAAVSVEPGVGAATVQVRATVAGRLGWLSRPESSTATVSMMRSNLPGTEPSSIHELLQSAVRPRRPLRVSLSVARPLAGACWEAWVASNLAHADLNIVRPYRSLYTIARPTPEQRDPGYLVLSPPRWRNLVQTSLAQADVEFLPQFPELFPGDVVIVVAIALNAASGHRLVVHNGESREKDLVIDSDNGRLIGATIIIIGEPRGQRSRTITRSAAALRQCAADLMDAGAQTVILVPNAPGTVVSRVLTVLATAIQPGAACSADKLLAAVSNARKHLDEAVEPALGGELTLMSRALPYLAPLTWEPLSTSRWNRRNR
jgi:hypothetical protein